VAHFNWSPGIGDPTLVGWTTVILYLCASFSCWKTACKNLAVRTRKSQERRLWQFISFLFLVLGINKQLDLQSALTEAGRMLAYSEGWYDQRQIVQFYFIFLITTLCGVAAIILLIWARNAPLATWLAITGTVLVFAFVLIRAGSFHHIDRFIGAKVFGLRWNWLLEIGGISLVFLASIWRRIQIADLK